MKHIIPLTIKTGTKILYQIFMIFGAIVFVLFLGLSVVAVPLIFPAGLGLLIFLITYFTVKEVYAENVNLIVEANGDELIVYRENNKGYQTKKTILRASELSSIKVIKLNGSFGITYYYIEALRKGRMRNKMIKLLSPVLGARENEILNILQVIQKQYSFIEVGH